VFNVLCLSQMAHVMAIRSQHQSAFRMSLFSNKPLLGSVLLTLLLQLAVTYTPFMHAVFQTESLNLREFVIVGAASMIVFIGVELEKLIVRRKHRE